MSLELEVGYRLGEYKQLVVEFRPRSKSNCAGEDRFNLSPLWTHPLMRQALSR